MKKYTVKTQTIISDLLVSTNKRQVVRKEANRYLSWQLTDRQICDLELLLNGGFSPLTGFMGIRDYESVLKDMRLLNGSLWPIPIILDVTESFADTIKDEEKITLREKEGFTLAVLYVSDLWKPDLEKEAKFVYGTTDITHPAVNYLFKVGNKVYVGGTLEGTSLPHHYDYQIDRHTPSEIRGIFEEKGWSKIVAFQTRNPLHRAHVEMTTCASKELDANLLIHPVVGMT